MPRNPDGSPAARSLIATLAEAGVSTTPRRLESLWQAGLIPKITGKGPPAPRDVEHVACVLAELGERKRRPGVAVRTALRGFDVDAETVRDDLLDGTARRAQLDAMGTGPDGDNDFARIEGVASLAGESEDPVFTDLRKAMHRGIETAELTWPGEPTRLGRDKDDDDRETVRDQEATGMVNLVGMVIGQPAYAPSAVVKPVFGLLPPNIAARLDSAEIAEATRVAASLTGPEWFAEAFRTLPIPALVADARKLLPVAQFWMSLIHRPEGRAEAAELFAFHLAAIATRIPGMAAVETCTECLPTGEPAPLPSRG